MLRTYRLTEIQTDRQNSQILGLAQAYSNYISAPLLNIVTLQYCMLRGEKFHADYLATVKLLRQIFATTCLYMMLYYIQNLICIGERALLFLY